jgi:hypothetical protein
MSCLQQVLASTFNLSVFLEEEKIDSVPNRMRSGGEIKDLKTICIEGGVPNVQVVKIKKV